MLKNKLFFISISFISASNIAYEILLTRLLSIIQWHHFAYMIVSIALLGFGASGTIITLFRKKLTQHFKDIFLISCLISGFSTVLCFLISQKVPFNPFTIVWDKHQYLYLLIYYLIFLIPFFFGATCIGLALTQFKEKIEQVYFFNLLGSGIGALIIILAMYWLSPINNLLFVSGLAFLAGLISASSLRRIIVFFILITAFLGYFLINEIELQISQYKGLSSALNFPKAKVISKDFSPLGTLHVVKSPAIHSAAGLSLNYQGELPPQLGLFTDADSMSAITQFDGNISKLKYLDYTTAALPYHLLKKPNVLILGTGGGTGILRGIYHKSSSIDAVELNPKVIELVNNRYGDFSSHIYTWNNQDTQIKAHVAEARGYVQSTKQVYDLIEVSLLDSYTAASAGVYALSENYLYTVESIIQYLKCLNSEGILAITRWLKFPPRDSLKMIAIITEAIKSQGGRVDERLVFIRGWQTCTILVKKNPLTNQEIQSLKTFCGNRSFDLVYYPGIKKSELNRYNILDEPEYYHGVQSILSSVRTKFYNDYIFNINPTTDNRPYFFHFFKWESLPYLLKKVGRDYIPFLEWGYIILIATLIQAVFVSLLLIILPLFFLKKRGESKPNETLSNNKSPNQRKTELPRYKIVIYFLGLGLGFMFIEMTFIQKFMLLLSYPTYAISIVLFAFLFFAGLGSFFCKRIRFKNYNPISISIISIIILGLIYLFFLDFIFQFFLASPDSVKIIVSIILICPLAFFMGMPFPLGLSKVATRTSYLVPWAYAINGCASVVSAVLSTIIAISLGFFWVTLIAIGLYGVSWLVYADRKVSYTNMDN